MDIAHVLLMAVAIIAAVLLWNKTVGRFSGYINGIVSVFLFSVLAYIIIVAIVAVAFGGATSVDEIIAMLY